MGKIDPRVIKTRRKLKTAFLALLAKQNLSEINVKDLTQTADVTRGTFYLHYKDKETFIKKMMQELIDEFFEATIHHVRQDSSDSEAEMPVLSLLNTFEYIGERPDFFTVLLKEKDATVYRDQMSETLYSFIEAHRASQGVTASKVPKELLMNFLMYSLLGVADGWLANGKIYAHHFMAENVHKLLTSELINEAGLRDFFVTEVTEA